VSGVSRRERGTWVIGGEEEEEKGVHFFWESRLFFEEGRGREEGGNCGIEVVFEVVEQDFGELGGGLIVAGEPRCASFCV